VIGVVSQSKYCINFNDIMYDENAYRAELLDIIAQVYTPNNLIEKLAKEEVMKFSTSLNTTLN